MSINRPARPNRIPVITGNLRVANSVQTPGGTKTTNPDSIIYSFNGSGELIVGGLVNTYNNNSKVIKTSVSSGVNAQILVVGGGGGTQENISAAPKGYGGGGVKGSQLYAYPFDIDLQQDHLKISRYEYQRSSINASKPPTLEGADVENQGSAAQFDNVYQTRKVDGGSVLGVLKGSVILPMPKVTDVNAADWGKSELNAQGMAAAGLASKLIGQPGETPDERERRLAAFQQLKDERGGEQGGSVRRKTTGAVYNQIVAKTAGTLLGTDLNADTVLARQGGTVLNPNAEMLFQGPALRDFTFKYRMIARSQKEGVMIRNIIRFLKLGMAPKFRSSTYLKSPDVFSLEYRRGSGEAGILDTVNRFSPGGLALTSINTDYAPNSYWSAYQDSQPVEITMDLNFVELRPIYYNDQALTPTSSVGY